MRGCKPLTFDRQLCPGRIATTRKDLKSAKDLIHAPVAQWPSGQYQGGTFYYRILRCHCVGAQFFPKRRGCHWSEWYFKKLFKYQKQRIKQLRTYSKHSTLNGVFIGNTQQLSSNVPPECFRRIAQLTLTRSSWCLRGVLPQGDSPN